MGRRHHYYHTNRESCCLLELEICAASQKKAESLLLIVAVKPLQNDSYILINPFFSILMGLTILFMIFVHIDSRVNIGKIVSLESIVERCKSNDLFPKGKTFYNFLIHFLLDGNESLKLKPGKVRQKTSLRLSQKKNRRLDVQVTLIYKFYRTLYVSIKTKFKNVRVNFIFFMLASVF